MTLQVADVLDVTQWGALVAHQDAFPPQGRSVANVTPLDDPSPHFISTLASLGQISVVISL